MIHHQANVLILLALAGATLLCLVLECQAGRGQGEKIDSKEKWLSVWDERLGEHMVEKVTPEQTVEILKQLQAAMPQDELSEEWQKKRTELDSLIDMANLDEECVTDYVLERFNERYDLSGYLLPALPLVRDYAKYFQNKQIEICVATISNQMSAAVAGMNEEDKRDMETLMSYSPKLEASDNLEWDDLFVGAIEEGEDEQRFYRDIYRFLKTKEKFLSEKEAVPNSWWKVSRVYDDGMQFCRHVSSATRIPVDKYLDIRRYAELDEWVTRFSPETLKWVKAAKLCWQVNFDKGEVKQVVYNEFIKDHQKAYDQFEKASKPSRASRMLDCLRPKRKNYY